MTYLSLFFLLAIAFLWLRLRARSVALLSDLFAAAFGHVQKLARRLKHTAKALLPSRSAPAADAVPAPATQNTIGAPTPTDEGSFESFKAGPDHPIYKRGYVFGRYVHKGSFPPKPEPEQRNPAEGERHHGNLPHQYPWLDQ